MTNHLHWTTLNADARHFDSRLQKEQHDAAMPVMYVLYPLNLSSIVQVQVCQSWPATGQTWDTFQKSFPTMGPWFFFLSVYGGCLRGRTFGSKAGQETFMQITCIQYHSIAAEF